MKWGVVILLIFGVVAAACAALLVSMMGGGSRAAGKGTQGIEVAVAKKSLPAGEVIKTDDFVIQRVSRNDLADSPGRIAAPATVTGQTLAVNVTEGQILTDALFAPQGSVQQLISQMPPGGCFYTLTLSPRSAPDRLFLYPGCVVDVLFSARLSGREAPGQALSTTMLQRLPVVAVQGESVLSDPKNEDKGKASRSSGNLQVTFMVDPNQAQALQLISSNGDITLVVRNPLDKSVRKIPATVYNQGRLANFGKTLRPEDVLAAAQKAEQKQQGADSMASQLPGASGAQDANQPNGAAQNSNSRVATALAAPASQPGAEQTAQAAQGSRLMVTVIRGKETKNEEFKLSGGEAGAEK
jgi:Flp pilus assembly protein CpaB